jgi:hypothetical protein
MAERAARRHKEAIFSGSAKDGTTCHSISGTRRLYPASSFREKFIA